MERNQDFLFKCSMDHVLELLFGFDLLVENSKCDVLKVGQDVLLVIDEGCLSDKVDQLISFFLLLTGLECPFSLCLKHRGISLVYGLSVIVNNFIHLSIFKVFNVLHQVFWLF